MSGIAGFFFADPISLEKALEATQRCFRTLHHRGPEGQGWVLFTDSGPLTSQSFAEQGMPSEAKVFGGLVHTRLKIIDLSERAHQPMTASSGRYWLVYNGEVYNFREIRRDLEGLGWEFTSTSDTEVVLKAYLQWGTHAFDKFRGMFSLAVYDATERTLCCARDAIGIKPFYYHQWGEGFVFASDVSTLIASGFYHPKPDWNSLCLGIAFQGAPRPRTAYLDVVALQPGHHLSGPAAWSKQMVKYWDLPVGQTLDLTEDKALSLYEELLRQAVKRCLVSDVEVGTLMSGGIDSTTMTAFAAEERPRIRAFTVAHDYALDDSQGLHRPIPQRICISFLMWSLASAAKRSLRPSMIWFWPSRNLLVCSHPIFLSQNVCRSMALRLFYTVKDPTSLWGGTVTINTSRSAFLGFDVSLF